jgi:hypothetical protein
LVYNQHKVYLDNHDDPRNPRQAFLDYLSQDIRKWQEEGDQLVIGMDANEDVRSGILHDAMSFMQLREAVTTRHGNLGPRTFRGGSKPIDGLFVSLTLLDSRCGYLPFLPWFDHRCLYINIPASIAFGHALPPVATQRARQLKCQDPRIMEKYTSLYSQFLQEHNLVERAFSLQTIMTYSANSAMTDEWESIDALRVKGMQEAERNCRKFRTGEVPWSPILQEIMDRIAAWKLMRRKREGKRVSSCCFCAGRSVQRP